jgi:PAS domain S-box-containing protein
VEATADGILVADGRGNIKDFNRKFIDIWGIPESVIETRDDDKALSFVLSQLKDPHAFITKVKELCDQPDVESMDMLEFRDGRVIERYSKPQILGGRVTGRVWSFRDVTEKHNTQSQQEQLLRQVADANEELSHFAYVISHDLKAPLRGIRLLADWLCADYGDQLGSEAQENLQLLQSRVERMHGLIDGVLQYSRVGRIHEDKVDLDLNELLPTIVDTVAPPEHVTVTVEGPLPTIECEQTRITQVFQNLITNAVKYMDKPEGQVVVGCQDAGDCWQFSVADNGPGIEEKYFDRIFKIFQTLVPRDEFESTGVGLTLVKKIVELYGGRVWVESELGKGSTFCFTLPKQPRPEACDQPTDRSFVGAAEIDSEA